MGIRKIVSIEPVTDTLADVAVINSISKRYKEVRQKSKTITFLL